MNIGDLKQTQTFIDSSTNINLAFKLAQKAHRGQIRKLNDAQGKPIPYIKHPVKVVSILREFEGMTGKSFDDAVYMTALLHDVLEDTEYTSFDLTREWIPGIIVRMVEDLSNFNTIDDDRMKSVEQYSKQLERSFVDVQYIKAADIYANADDVVDGKESWKKRFQREKFVMLYSLKKIDSAVFDLVEEKLLEIV